MVGYMKIVKLSQTGLEHSHNVKVCEVVFTLPKQSNLAVVVVIFVRVTVCQCAHSIVNSR